MEGTSQEDLPFLMAHLVTRGTKDLHKDRLSAAEQNVFPDSLRGKFIRKLPSRCQIILSITVFAQTCDQT